MTLELKRIWRYPWRHAKRYGRMLRIGTYVLYLSSPTVQHDHVAQPKQTVGSMTTAVIRAPMHMVTGWRSCSPRSCRGPKAWQVLPHMHRTALRAGAVWASSTARVRRASLSCELLCSSFIKTQTSLPTIATVVPRLAGGHDAGPAGAAATPGGQRSVHNGLEQSCWDHRAWCQKMLPHDAAIHQARMF